MATSNVNEMNYKVGDVYVSRRLNDIYKGDWVFFVVKKITPKQIAYEILKQREIFAAQLNPCQSVHHIRPVIDNDLDDESWSRYEKRREMEKLTETGRINKNPSHIRDWIKFDGNFFEYEFYSS
jgi:hypothetical protein